MTIAMRDEADIRELLEKCVGPQLTKMLLESRIFAETQLASTEPSVRVAALTAISHYWGPDESFKRVCERLVLTDPSPDLRKSAMACVYQCYHKTDPASVGRIAAKLTYDSSQPPSLRLQAYRMLFAVRGGRLAPEFHTISPDSPSFRFPEDVDWILVDRFLYNQP